MISGDMQKFWGKKIESETYKTQSSQMKKKKKKIIVQNLSWRIVFQEKVKFLKSGIWFQFYSASNKDTFFESPGMSVEMTRYLCQIQ